MAALTRAAVHAIVLGALAVLSVACGGGGGSSGYPGTGGSVGPPDAGSDVVTATADNMVAVTVDPGPAGTQNVNGLFTTVTLCAPGTTQCQTFDHFLVDTGSVGVRVLGTELTLSLPGAASTDGQQLFECLPFVLGTSWGPVVTADVKVGGEVATSLPIQVVDDRTTPVPTTCTGPAVNSLQTLLAKGILGVGVTLQDCGASCARAATSPMNPGLYYGCPAGQASCAVVSAPVASQVSHPVAAFPVDNNGTIISLPAIDARGAATVQGALTFGIGTRANNGLGSATVVSLDASGLAATTFQANSKAYASYIDSGSNGLYFLDGATTGLQACTTPLDGFYCPPAAVSLTAVMSSNSGARASISFSVANAATLNGADSAFNDLAGESPGFGSDPGAVGFDWGMPFFFGRNVYTAIESRGTPAGPYFAF